MKLVLTAETEDDSYHEDITAFQQMINGPKTHHMFWKIDQQLFRPAFKHGYNGKLGELWRKVETNEDAAEFFYAIREAYWELLRDANIKVDP